MLEKGQRLYTGVGAFEVVEHLGRGKTADVWKAVNTREPEKYVAVKYARAGMESLVKTNFEKEARVLRAFEDIEAGSGFFPIFYNQGEHEGKIPYVIMSLISSQPIAHLAGQQPERRLSGSIELEREAINAALSYAAMLVIVHKAGYAAVDRKLEDVYWDGQKVTVLDWNVVGTSDVAKRHDLYQFGVFWYQLVMGALPPEPGQSLEGRGGWDSLTYGTRGILTRALHPSRDGRYQTVDELRTALARLSGFLNLSLKELETGALGIVESSPDEAYLMLDIIEKHYRADASSKAHEEWIELDRQKQGAWQTLIAQGRGSLEQGEFTVAAGDFSQAMEQAGDNPERRLQTYRWSLLAKGLQSQKFVELSETAISSELVTALNGGDWSKAAAASTAIPRTAGEALANLLADLQIMVRTAEADKAIYARNYQMANSELQQALASLKDLPHEQQELLANAGWQAEQMSERAEACFLLAGTEGTAAEHLQKANQALDGHQLEAAGNELDAGLGLIINRSVIRARSELADRQSLQPPLDQNYYDALKRFLLHQVADRDRSPEWGKRRQALRELTEARDGDPWAKREIQRVREELLSKLKTFDLDAHEQPAVLANQFYLKDDELQADEEMQVAFAAHQQAARQSLDSLIAGHATFIERAVKTAPTEPLLKAGEERILWAQRHLNQTVRLSPLLFSRTEIELQSERITEMRSILEDAHADFSELKGKAESRGVTFDSLGDGLNSQAQALVQALLEEDRETWQREENRAQVNQEALSQAYLQAGEEMINLQMFLAAEEYFKQIVEARWSTPASRDKAKDAVLRLHDFEKQRHDGEERIDQALGTVEKALAEKDDFPARIGHLEFARSLLEEVEKIDLLKARAQALQEVVIRLLARENANLVKAKVAAIGFPKEDIAISSAVSLERYIEQAVGILTAYDKVVEEFPDHKDEIEKRKQEIRQGVKLRCVDQPFNYIKAQVELLDSTFSWASLREYINSYQSLFPLISSALAVVKNEDLELEFEELRILVCSRRIRFLNGEIYQSLAEEPVKWESIHLWQREIEDLRVQLPDEALQQLPARPVEDILDAAERLENNRQYAPALQLTRQVIQYAKFAVDRDEELFERAEALESRILAGYYNPEYLQEVGLEYAERAMALFNSKRSQPAAADYSSHELAGIEPQPLSTGSYSAPSAVGTPDWVGAEYEPKDSSSLVAPVERVESGSAAEAHEGEAAGNKHRALEFFGLAIYYNPQLPLSYAGDKDFDELLRLWQKDRDRKLEADWLFTRSQAQYSPSMESRLDWLQRANELDPDRGDIAEALVESARRAKPDLIASINRAIGKLDLRSAEDTVGLLESICELLENEEKCRKEVKDYRAQTDEAARVISVLEKYQMLGDQELLLEAETHWPGFKELVPRSKVPKSLISMEEDLLKRVDDVFDAYRDETGHMRAFKRISDLSNQLKKMVNDNQDNGQQTLVEFQR